MSALFSFFYEYLFPFLLKICERINGLSYRLWRLQRMAIKLE